MYIKYFFVLLHIPVSNKKKMIMIISFFLIVFPASKYNYIFFLGGSFNISLCSSF